MINTRAMMMKTFDLRSTIEPFSFLQIVTHCKRIAPGEKVVIITNEKSVTADLTCLLSGLSMSLETISCQDDTGSCYRIFLKKYHSTEVPESKDGPARHADDLPLHSTKSPLKGFSK